MVIAFDKILRKIKQFSHRGEGSLEAWMRKIVINECLMRLRRNHNFNMSRTLDEAAGVSDLSQMESLGAEDIYKMIAQLPTGYRTVFNLHAVEGYTHNEIAAQLNISEGTSRSQLSKAKAQLKRMLNNEGEAYGT
jgi:RNA polymerase sigma-70 factor, ECF subfamily